MKGKKVQRKKNTDGNSDAPLLQPPQTGSRLVVAVSGGPDSVYLLMRLLKMKDQYEMIIAHINHGIRGEKSDGDEMFVKKFAEKNGLPFESARIKKTRKGNLEEFLRDERYALLEKIRVTHKAGWIVTAHHLNDNIETILFNSIRGSFLEGLCGMDVRDEKRHIWRPLLAVSKEQILQNLKKKRIPFRKDESNDDINFSRNALRKKVIPVLKKINPGFEKTAARNAENMKELADYLETETSAWIQKNMEQGGISQKAFLKTHPVIQKSIIAHLYRSRYGNTKNFNQAHLEQILSVVASEKSNRSKEFGPACMISVSNRNGKRIIHIRGSSS